MNFDNVNLRGFIESIGTATIIFDPDAVVIACNSASEKLFGRPDGGLVGRRLTELDLYIVNSDGTFEQSDVFPINKIASGEKEVVQFDFGLHFSPLEQSEWLRASLKPSLAENGESSFLVFSLDPITDLVSAKITNTQVFQAKSEWEATVDALPDIVTIQDLEMRIIRANKVAHDLFGHRLGELKGKKCYEVFHNIQSPCRDCPVERTRKDNCPHTGPIFNKVLGRTFSLSSFPVFDQNGNMQQLVQVARDVTQYLRNESEKNRLMAAIEQVSESVVITGSSGEIQYVNETFEETTGYSRDEAIGRNTNILKSGAHDRQFYESMWTTLLNKDVWRGRLTNRRKNGTVFKENTTISPVLDNSGAIINFVALKRDVTREELLEMQLHQGMKMEALGTLAGGIAHDFNNILSSIIGYGEIAKGHLAADHPARKELEQVIAGGDRAVDLVRQILAFSRRDNSAHFQLISLQHVINDVIKLLRPILPATIELRHEIDNSCPTIFADHSQLYQVVMNLCTNARQSIGDDHGRITIKLRVMETTEGIVGSQLMNRGAEVILDLEVSDNGRGIDEEKLEKIFDPFYTTKKKEQGTGLGLAVVHGIIQKHKGEIRVSSTVGVGTTFHIYLAADGREVVGRRAMKKADSGGNERIMVIDDEVAVSEMLRTILQDVGYSVITYNSSIDAVKKFRMDPYCCDLVITDLTMPDMTGAELAREFLGQRPEIPIIILTGYSEACDRNRAKQLGVKEYLQKPMKKEELYRVIRKVLENG
ncbi:MAG: PAS domain S-box protein [Desulforhopalus sp.]